MEAFKVWTSLEIKGNAIKQMERFATFTLDANKHIKEMNERLNLLNRRFLVLSNRLSLIGPHTENLLDFMKGLNRTTNLNNRSFERYNSQLFRSQQETSILSEKTSVLAEKTVLLEEGIKGVSIQANLAAGAMSRMSAASRLSDITTKGGAASRGGHSGSHFTSHALRETGMGSVAPAALGLVGAYRFGGPILVGGLATGMMFHRGYEKNVEYMKELAQFRALGFSPRQIGEVENMTSVVVPGISPIRQIQAFRDAQMATRQFSDAKTLAPELGKFKFIADAMFSGISDVGLQNAIRIAELRGGANPQKIKDELTTVAQMYVTSGGTIDPTRFLPFFKGYQGANRLSREALLALEPTFQEYSPVKTATALQTLYGRLQGQIRLKEEDLDFFNRMGLFKNGKMDPRYRHVLDVDPEAFFETVWLPLLKKMGITTPDEIAAANIHLGRTPSQFFSALGKNTEKAARSRQQASGLMGMDELMKTAFKTESGSALRFMQALESLIVAFGKFSSPAVIVVLNSLSTLMERMAKSFGSTNPREDMDKAIGVRSNPIDWSGWLHHFRNSPVSVSPLQKNETHVNVHLDGQKIAKVVAKHQSDALTRGGTQSAPSGVNPMMTPQPTGINQFGGFN